MNPSDEQEKGMQNDHRHDRTLSGAVTCMHRYKFLQVK